MKAREKSAWIHQREVVTFCTENTNLIGKGRAFNIVCLGFRKAFKAVCCKDMKYEDMKYGLDEWSEVN